MPDTAYDMHNDTWWMRALDGELTPEEQRAWEAHLVRCARCRLEWDALADLDQLFTTTSVPAPSPGFVAKTIAKVERAAWRRQVASLLGGGFIIAVILLVEVAVFNAVFSDVTRMGEAVLASRDVLFQTWMRIWVSLIALGDMLPLTLIVLVASLLLVMPSGILATLTFVLVQRQRGKASVGA
jgi:anti-sigma factor RsiW